MKYFWVKICFFFWEQDARRFPLEDSLIISKRSSSSIHDRYKYASFIWNDFVLDEVEFTICWKAHVSVQGIWKNVNVTVSAKAATRSVVSSKSFQITYFHQRRAAKYQMKMVTQAFER